MDLNFTPALKEVSAQNYMTMDRSAFAVMNRLLNVLTHKFVEDLHLHGELNQDTCYNTINNILHGYVKQLAILNGNKSVYMLEVGILDYTAPLVANANATCINDDPIAEGLHSLLQACLPSAEISPTAAHFLCSTIKGFASKAAARVRAEKQENFCNRMLKNLCPCLYPLEEDIISANDIEVSISDMLPDNLCNHAANEARRLVQVYNNKPTAVERKQIASKNNVSSQKRKRKSSQTANSSISSKKRAVHSSKPKRAKNKVKKRPANKKTKKKS